MYCYTDTNVLYSKIYESEEESDAHSALWRYRTRLSLHHLSISVQTKNYEVLNKFLKQVFFIIYICIGGLNFYAYVYRNLP